VWSEKDFFARWERYRELRREAERGRLIHLAQSRAPGPARPLRNVIGRLGTQLVKWGSRLQRDGAMPSPCCGEMPLPSADARRGDGSMLILKYVELTPDRPELKAADDHIRRTAAQVDGVRFMGLYTSLIRGVAVAVLEAPNLEAYLAWLRLCPPPPGVRATHEILLPHAPTSATSEQA